MDLAVLDRLDGPHLHLLLAEPRKVFETITYPLHESGKVVRTVRGQKMRTFQGLFDEFGAALQFPDYFGENWPAFDECLTDLDWLGYSVPGYVVVVSHASQLLADEATGQFEDLLLLFGRAAKEWAAPVEDGEWWDRPGRPFHVILQEAPDAGEPLLAKLRLADDIALGEVWRPE